MVDQLIILVNLKDEGVVNIVASEDLYRESRTKEYQANDKREVEGVSAWEYLFPIRIRILGWTDAYEEEEWCQNENPTCKESDHD